ncbi:hypothetical protein BF49_6880 [Bradyrhizobium sp.]|nr:hypothetical protein BF49_6880 [Bradyrhizobium sp.]
MFSKVPKEDRIIAEAGGVNPIDELWLIRHDVFVGLEGIRQVFLRVRPPTLHQGRMLAAVSAKLAQRAINNARLRLISWFLLELVGSEVVL